MAHAYTPGLKVIKHTIIRKERRLPLPGEVLVSKGMNVKAEDIVARTELPGNVQPVNVAGLLSAPPEDVPDLMLYKKGDTVKKEDVIAESKGLFGLFKSKVASPVNGTIESISSITGQVILREPPLPVEVDAYIDGKVVEVIPKEGVIVETEASFIQGIFGLGGEKKGIIRNMVRSPDEELKSDNIDESCRYGIIIGGSFVDVNTLKKAVEVGASAVVVGGIDDENLRAFLGYDLGVAITGSEEKGVTLIITEGFGKLRMAQRTFELFQELEGKRASVNGATQIRAGVIRPEVIVPTDKSFTSTRKELSEGLVVGSLVRVIREPYFGKIGKVEELPPELVDIETEAKVRILKLKLDSGELITIPRANVEIIEL